MSYAIWDAAIDAGATLEELYKLDKGEYPAWFLAKLVAWKRSASAIRSHTEDAKYKAAKNK